jgi:hypothetical protein
MEELAWNIEQNKKALAQQLKDVAEYITSLQNALETGSEPRVGDWTGGYVARDVALVTASLARHHALNEALRIVKKG